MNTKTKDLTENNFRTLFLTPGGFRLRAGWRLVIHTILTIVLSGGAGIALFIPIRLFNNIGFYSLISVIASVMATLFAITLSTFISRIFLDKQSIISLGLKLDRLAICDVLAGITIAFFLMGVVFSLEILLGRTRFEGFANEFLNLPALFGSLGAWLVIFIFVGWQEELLARGYHLQTIESGLNLFWAVLISSSIFGIMHLFNPGTSWASTLGIFLAGLFLAFPYILTRQLWLSIGLHIGWNFFEGVVFGFPVSGLTTFKLLHHTVTGPDLWTGGAYGPEAGLLIIPVLMIGSLLVFAYTRSGIRSTNNPLERIESQIFT